MLQDKIAIKKTADGSHTLYVEGLDETYHSTHGAIQEALHVFIDAGLSYFNQQKLTILELGFGTGLNAFLTLIEAHKQKLTIDYTSIEAYPLPEDIIEQLNYTTELSSNTKEIGLFQSLHQVEWGSYQEITSQFNLNKIKKELVDYHHKESFDIIYFDAFGPRVQPEMWTETILRKMYDSLAKEGILVTYCAKGSVKRAMKTVGFEVESLPGPPGKREMTRAKKT